MPNYRSPVQSPSNRAWYRVLAVFFLLFLPLCACGKKPNQVDPPPGAEETVFPKTYPDPATDPKP